MLNVFFCCPDIHIVQAEDRSNTAETNIGRIRAGSQVPSAAGCLYRIFNMDIFQPRYNGYNNGFNGF